MENVRDKLIGLRVMIVGADHPHRGECGTCIDVRDTPWGPRPVVKTEESIEEFFVLDPKDWCPDPRYCERCGALKAHSRLRGMFCMRCG